MRKFGVDAVKIKVVSALDANLRLLELTREVLGADYFNRREETTNDFNAPIRRFSEENCFGEIWSRYEPIGKVGRFEAAVLRDDSRD